MQENTNKAIAINTVISYTQLGISIITGLLSTRFALKALGVDDFGLFSVVGSIISFVAIVNSIMLSTSNRFIAVAIGKGSIKEVNEQFNINLSLHVAFAVIVLLLSFPLGKWYIINYVNYDGDIENVIKLFNITMIGSVIASIGVPYNGVLIAKERFLFFSIVNVIRNVSKLLLSYLLIYYFSDKLLIYGIGLSVLEAAPTLIFYLYCSLWLRDIVELHIVKRWDKYREMLAFSVWVGYGALASIARSSGSALIINLFFTTAMNAALGIANTISAVLRNFSTNVTKSIAPQITKSYASGNIERSEKLVCLASKLSFMIMFFISTPFLIAPEFVFSLWLDETPDYVIIFTVLIIIEMLVGVLNAGVPDIVFANGNIKWYQIIESTLLIMSVLGGYFVLSLGAPVYYYFIVYIVFSLFVLVIRQILLQKIVKINSWRLIKESFIPSGIIFILYLPILFVRLIDVHPIVHILLSYIYVIILLYIVGLRKDEKNYLDVEIRKILRR